MASAGAMSSTIVRSGRSPAVADQPHHGDLFFQQAPRRALVHDVREQVAVRDHDLSRRERRRDHFFDELGPARHVKQHLGAHRKGNA